MRLSEIKGIIAAGIKANVSTCLWSNPGLGKTSFVRDYAKEIGYDFIHINCFSLESTDLAIPSIEGEGKAKEVEYIPCSWVKRAAATTKDTIIFLDELNRIKPENLNLLTTLVLEKEVYGIKLSDKVTFIAAGNFESNCVGARELDTAIYTRFAHLLFDPPAMDSIPYMGNSTIQDFLRGNMDLFEDDGQEEMFSGDVLDKLTNNRRSMEFALRFLNDKSLSISQKRAVAQGLIGMEAGYKLSSLFDTFMAKEERKVPNVVKGNEDKLHKLLSEGMVAEVMALLGKEWDTGDRDLRAGVAKFVLLQGTPELLRNMIAHTQTTTNLNDKFTMFIFEDEDVKDVKWPINSNVKPKSLNVGSLIITHTELSMKKEKTQ